MLERKHNRGVTAYAKALRREMTTEERRLWYDYLRTYPVRFYRQKVLGKYIVDFYCAKAKLVVELDGSQHFRDDGMQYDEQRTAFLAQYGLTVIRIPNNDINNNFRGVCDYIDNYIKRAVQNEESPPCVREGGTAKP